MHYLHIRKSISLSWMSFLAYSPHLLSLATVASGFARSKSSVGTHCCVLDVNFRMLKSLSSSIRLQSYEELFIYPILYSNFCRQRMIGCLLEPLHSTNLPIHPQSNLSCWWQPFFDKGASGGSIDIDPGPFQASRMAQLLCKAPLFLFGTNLHIYYFDF